MRIALIYSNELWYKNNKNINNKNKNNKATNVVNENDFNLTVDETIKTFIRTPSLHTLFPLFIFIIFYG